MNIFRGVWVHNGHRARGDGRSPMPWFVRHCLCFLTRGAEMVSQCSFWGKSSKLAEGLVWQRPDLSWEWGDHVWSIIMCENILWQLCLGRHLADKMKKATPILHGRNRSHLPTLPCKHMTRTENTTGNFLFLTLIPTFIPPGSNSRAIPGFLQLLMALSVPELCPQWQQTGSNTGISSLCHGFTRTKYLLWLAFHQQNCTKGILGFRKHHVHIQSRQRCS